MAETSIFWTTSTSGDGAAPISQTTALKWIQTLFTPTLTDDPNQALGVARGVIGDLAVTVSTGSVDVAGGAAIVEGFWYYNSDAVNVAIPTPASATRIDRIVLRADHTAKTVRIARVAGVEGAGAPSLTNIEGTTWEIPLAQVSVTTGGAITLTDQRSYLLVASNHVKRAGDTMDGDLTVGVNTLSWAAGINTSERYFVDGTQVVANRIPGWSSATGTASRATFNTATVTTEQLAQRVMALLDDLLLHGLIGS